MRGWAQLATRVHRVLLAGYPSRFRAEHGEEMQDVLASALAEAEGGNGQRPWDLLWREIRDWPGSALRQHLRERRNREMATKGPLEEKPLPRIEWLAALILFVVPFLFALLRRLFAAGVRLPGWLDSVLIALFFGAVLLPLGWAAIKGMPRWSLPYLGLLLMVGAVLSSTDRIWGWIYPLFTGLLGPRAFWSIPIRIVYVAAFEFLLLISILAGGLILANLLRLPPHTRGVWGRIRADWTQLSFLLYGGLVFSIVVLFDEYRHSEAWQCLAWACLALGAWTYLRAKSPKRRILALIWGAGGAMGIVALAKYALIPLQKWPAGYPVSPSEVTRWVETGSALAGSVLVVGMLLAPALLNLLPQAPGPAVPSERKPLAA